MLLETEILGMKQSFVFLVRGLETAFESDRIMGIFLMIFPKSEKKLLVRQEILGNL